MSDRKVYRNRNFIYILLNWFVELTLVLAKFADMSSYELFIESSLIFNKK